MEKTDNFFVISNYNVDPTILTKYANNYLVYDQSDKLDVLEKNKENLDSRLIVYENPGHNLTAYFQYIYDNYELLPKRIAFLKGNIINRHVTQEFWDQNYDNKFYTLLWKDPEFEDKPQIAYSIGGGQFMERNNSWFVKQSSHRYFIELNQLISFLYDCSHFPEYSLFAPGGCYIVERERILRNPKSFYLGVIKILDYAFFPSEAWMIERLMHFFFTTDYPLKSYVFDEEMLLQKINDLPDRSNWMPVSGIKRRLARHSK